jgi:alpha/beta superfamily hydrolase
MALTFMEACIMVKCRVKMQKKVYFESSQGVSLCGILSDPNYGKDRFAAILCHGFMTGKDGRTYVRLEQVLNQAGIATLRFDFFGHGESEGDFAEITVSEAVDDVLHAISFMREKDFRNICLVGSSFGGLAVLIASAKSEGLRCLALKSPVSDYLSKLLLEKNRPNMKTWKRQGFIPIQDTEGGNLRLNYTFFEGAAELRGFDIASEIAVPTLIVHGDFDESVAVTDSQKLASMISDCRLEIIAGADHRYSRPEDFEKMLGLISGFIIQHHRG